MKPYKQENEKARRPRKKGMQDEAGYEKEKIKNIVFLVDNAALLSCSLDAISTQCPQLHPDAIHIHVKLIGANNEGSLQGLFRVQGAIGSL